MQLFAAVANAQCAEQDGFGERTGKIKIGARRFPAFASFDPFFVMADGARQRRSRTFVLLVAAFGNQTWMFAAPTCDEHFAFVTDEDDAVLGIELAFVFVQLIRPGRKYAPVIPVKLDRWHIAASRKLIM